MNRILSLLAVLAVIAAGGTWYAMQTGSEVIATPAAAQTESTEADEASSEEVAADEETEDGLAPDMAMGDAEAPVTLIEYASYTCPHCANFHEDVFKQLKADYIDTGKVQFVHREVYFDRYGLWAGMVARCGGEMRYFGLVDVLYSTQEDWIGSGDGDEVLANLRTIGKTAGMTEEQLETCLTDEALAQSMIAAYQTHAEADGITGTPSFVINGEKHSNMSYADLKEILDGLLEG